MCGDLEIAENIEVSTSEEVSSSKGLVDTQRSGASHTLSGPHDSIKVPEPYSYLQQPTSRIAAA